MKDNFDKCLAYVLRSEGGYVSHPADPGGRTNLGVTQKVWEEYVGHPVSEADMRALTPADVAPLYKRKYWDKVSGDLLPSGVDYCVFDAAINSGPGRASKWLQELCGVTVDGSIGAKTIEAASKTEDLIEKYQAKRLAFMQSLSTWSTFGRGWQRRVDDVRASALLMR